MYKYKYCVQDEDQRQKLNRITHPEIYKEMWWEAAKCAASGYQYIIMDLPLLFEAGIMVPYMHKIIVVTCEEDLQLQRLMEQRHLSERDAKLMIGAQMNLDQKEAMAQFVIENSGSLYDTTDQVNIHQLIFEAEEAGFKRILQSRSRGSTPTYPSLISTGK